MKGIKAGIRALGLSGGGVFKAASNSYMDSPHSDG